jgi:hypothetical protein
MSQQPRDALRSLHHYTAQHLLALDEEYDIRLAIEEDAWERPCAVVQSAGGISVGNRGRRVATSLRPYSIYVYPPAGSTAKDAEHIAARVEEQLAAMFQVGGYGGYPARIPNFDWADIDDDVGLPDDARPVAWLSVADASVDHKADPDDETLQTVWATIRLNWRGMGEPMPIGETLRSVSVEPDRIT